jgi:hypothetical protein
MSNSTKKRYLLGLGGIITVIAALVFAMTQVRIVRSGSITPTPTPQYHSQFAPNGTNGLARPSQTPLKITDLSPNIAFNDKGTVVIQHADGSREGFLVGPDFDIEAFIKQLPAGDKVVAGIPPPSISGFGPAPRITPGP